MLMLEVEIMALRFKKLGPTVMKEAASHSGKGVNNLIPNALKLQSSLSIRNSNVFPAELVCGIVCNDPLVYHRRWRRELEHQARGQDYPKVQRSNTSNSPMHPFPANSAS